jgi:hypothetical protein
MHFVYASMDVEISSLSIVDGKNMIGMGNSNKGG